MYTIKLTGRRPTNAVMACSVLNNLSNLSIVEAKDIVQELNAGGGQAEVEVEHLGDLPEHFELEAGEEVPAKEPVITEVDIGPYPGGMFGEMPTVDAVFSDGTEKELFSFYPDEIDFSAHELQGLTEQEAHDLYSRKDVSYLRS
jgi:hypothetical protein